jgi:cell division septation protein DedD
MRVVAVAALTGLAVVTLVAGCSREKIDWKSAESADTVAAYDRFIERHPDSELATQARERVAQLQEERDWKVATGADTADGYKEFLTKHPNGKWAEEARIRIESAGLAPNPSPLAVNEQPPVRAGNTAVPGEPAASAAAPPANTTPQTASDSAAPPPAATHVPSTPAGSSGYGIQLGAFSTQDAALAAWKRLQVTYDDQLHGLFAHAVPVQTASGQLFRLQAPVGAEVRARSICGALTQKSQPCVVVLPDTH